MMESVITSNFQTTIPKVMLKHLKITVGDTLEWAIENGKVVVRPAHKNFLLHRNSIKVGSGNIKTDIKLSRKHQAERGLH